MDRLCTLSPIGIVGYGINEESIDRAIDRFDIDVVAADAGSMDPGPNYFGRGEFFADEAVVERNLRILLNARERLDVPLLISSARVRGRAYTSTRRLPFSGTWRPSWTRRSISRASTRTSVGSTYEGGYETARSPR